MMQCRDIDELMVEFLYRELEGEQLAAFKKHVDGCGRCGAEMKSLVRTREALRALPEAEPSSAVSARLLHEAAKRASKEERGGVLAWIGKLFGPVAAHPAWAAVASLLLVAGLAGFLSVRARIDGPPREETVTASAPAAAEPAPTAPAQPRDVTVPGADGTRNELAKSLGDKVREVAEEKPAAGAGAKEVRQPGDPAPSPYPRKVAAPAIVAPVKKQADPAAADDRADRYGRTASTEEDQKLAEPEKAKRRPESARAKQELAEPPSGDADVGGIVAALPSPAPEQAPAQAQTQREGALDSAAAERGGTAGKGFAGAGPPSAPATASRPENKDAAKVSDDERAAPAEPQVQNKADTAAKPVAKVPPEQEMLQLAQKQATTGRCQEALGTRDKIARMNPEFYRRRVAGDVALRSCEEQNRKNRATPARAPKQPVAPDESSLDRVTK